MHPGIFIDIARMQSLYFLLFFIAGAAGVFLVYHSRVKKWSAILSKQIDALKTPGTKHQSKTEELPPDFASLLPKLEKIIQAPVEIIKPVEIPAQAGNADELKKRLDDLYIVNELGQKVTSSLNLEETFQHLYTTINSMMDAAVIELSVFNHATKTQQVFSNLPATLNGDPAAYVNHMAAWSFKNNREVFLEDAAKDFERYVFQPLILSDKRIAKSILIFPVMNGDAVSGTLSIISFQTNSFNSYHQSIVRLLLGYISVAIQNALTHHELNLTKIRAEQSEKFKEQFLANMSHEIRTPIHAVTGMTRLLIEKNPREEQLRYLENIRNASDSLLVIINDILDLSKIEAGKIELEQLDFSIPAIVRNVYEIIHFKTEEKGLMFTLEVDEGIPPVLVGDPTRITQILINLLGNAAKFTSKGKINLQVEQSQKEENGVVQMTFRVNDTGIGMSEEEQKKLFQEYAQASSATSRKYGGTGLGLSISKQLVQLQGGTIGVKSTKGEGSTFYFSLSFPVSKNKTVALKEKTISNEMLAKLEGIRVLVVDDNEYNQIVVKETLELKIKNIITDVVSGGNEALDKLKNNSYDVILMDLVMPDLNGFEITQKIRTEFPAPVSETKIIALTASVVKSEIDKCYATGMNGFIPKPFTTFEIIGAIYHTLFPSDKEPSREFIPLKHPSSNPDILIDYQILEEFSEGDELRLKRYVELFLMKTPTVIAELKFSSLKKDYEKIRITAHSMKPQLRFTGVTKALELAETIEQNCAEKNNLEEIPVLIEKLGEICEQAMDELRRMKV